MSEPALSALSVDEFRQALAARTSAPGGGAASAVVVSYAAALAAMAARFGPGGAADGTAARADTLGARAAGLADADAAAYGDFLSARRRLRETGEGREEVQAALSRAVDVPLEVGEIAAQVAELAQPLAGEGNPHLHGDAVTAALLAAAAATAAATLVGDNLGDAPDDPRTGRALDAAARARAAADLAAGS